MERPISSITLLNNRTNSQVNVNLGGYTSLTVDIDSKGIIKIYGVKRDASNELKACFKDYSILNIGR